MSELKNVLFVINSLLGGGAERVLTVLADQFAALGIKTTVGLIESKEKRIAYALDPEVVVADFSVDTAQGVKGVAQSLFRLRRFIKTQKPDVIIPFMVNNAVLTLGACLGLRYPVVIRPTIVLLRWGTKITRLAAPYLLPRAKGAVYQVEAQRDLLYKYIRGKGIILPNPIKAHATWSNPRQYDEKAVIAVGRLDNQKNYPLLIRAFSALGDNFPDWRLEIYGDGPARTELQSEIDGLSLNGRIALAGFADDVHAVMHEASVFVMSSKYEGMPNALMEALCAGCACVTTDFDGGAARVLINDGENGLVTPNDDLESMINALRRLMGSEELRRTLGQNAAKMKEKVDARHIALQWISYLESVISAD